MKFDLRDKKIVIPIIIFVGVIAFIILFYNPTEEAVVVDDNENTIKTNVGDVSSQVAERDVEDKLTSYDNLVRENRDKYTAIQELDEDKQLAFSDDDVYTDEEKEEIRRIEEDKQRRKMELKTGDTPTYKSTRGYKNINNNLKDDTEEDDLAELISNMKAANENMNKQTSTEEEKPLNQYEEMRKQYLFLDSLQKANDPDIQSRKLAEERDQRILEAIERNKLSRLTVGKLSYNENFNSFKRKKEGEFIKAVIDEDITGYAGSRIRIRLLEDIYIGNQLMRKNNYLYALITGFNEQRVRLNIVSVMYENEILPIKLSVYDVDGMEGLYVPSSQFREFTKELGDASVQGMSTNNIGTGEDQQQFFTSMMSRVFQSTSSAISKIIRQNKAKLKYNSFVYLVDDKSLEETKKNIYEQNKAK